MKLDKKGQALVEFILILPLFLMILFVIVDFGVIFNAKSTLENDSADILALMQNKTDITTIESTYPNLEINVKEEKDFTRITITNHVDLITPGLNRILEDPYEIKVERLIPHD